MEDRHLSEHRNRRRCLSSLVRFRTLLLALAAGLVPTGAFAATATIQWQANPAPDIMGYRLFYGTPPGRLDQAIDCGPSTRVVLSDLHPGRQYSFEVRCYDLLGLESPPSETLL